MRLKDLPIQPLYATVVLAVLVVVAWITTFRTALWIVGACLVLQIAWGLARAARR